jgi:hypothetical protein
VTGSDPCHLGVCNKEGKATAKCCVGHITFREKLDVSRDSEQKLGTRGFIYF